MWGVFVTKINKIETHTNADNLEIIKIYNDQQLVVKKNEYSVGQNVIYFPQDSLLPIELLEKLNLVGRLGGKNKNRVCPIRLRGELSIGIVCPADENFVDGKDYSEFFGVTKYEQPIPTMLAGTMTKMPEHRRVYDLENIKISCPFASDDNVVITEKIHGTQFSCVYLNDQFYVMSKNVSLARSETNTYWQAAIKYNLESICRREPGTWVFGEVYGPVQDLHYDSPHSIRLRVFDIRVGDTFKSWDYLNDFCHHNDLMVVPLIYSGSFGNANIQELTSGKSLLGDNIREGIVIKDYEERSIFSDRIIKSVSPEYLFRKHGTEYN